MTKKILIMDDEPTIADLLAEVVADEGYEAYKITQSLRFYDALKEHEPDLVLMDLKMPYLEGHDELQLMKMGIDRQIPVIVITAYPPSTIKEERELHEAGVVSIMQKPMDIERLLDLIKETIGEP